jgi:hypothetical protein
VSASLSRFRQWLENLNCVNRQDLALEVAHAGLAEANHPNLSAVPVIKYLDGSDAFQVAVVLAPIQLQA